MERVISRGDFKFYTMLKQIIFDLALFLSNIKGIGKELPIGLFVNISED